MSGTTCLVTGATSGIGKETALRLGPRGRLDVLVNNAGVISPRRQLTANGLETTFATNHLGPFLLTSLLHGLLERSAPARVVTVSSAAHKQVGAIPWDDLARGAPSGQAQAYPVSKLL